MIMYLDIWLIFQKGVYLHRVEGKDVIKCHKYPLESCWGWGVVVIVYSTIILIFNKKGCNNNVF